MKLNHDKKTYDEIDDGKVERSGWTRNASGLKAYGFNERRSSMMKAWRARLCV